MSGTIHATLDSVAQTFRLDKLESPVHNAAGRLDPRLALQLKKCADDNPGAVPKQVTPLEMIRTVQSWARDKLVVAVGQLVVTAFFFAMRSCKYSDVGSGRLTSSVVGVDNIRFRRRGEVLPALSHKKTRDANTVTITLRRQKKGDKGAKLTQHRNDNPDQADICPVRAFANLFHRVKGNERTGRTSLKINALVTLDSDEPKHASSKTILGQLRITTTLTDEERLGLRSDRIGTHLISSGTAMAMHLAGVPSETIWMVGRRRSRTFMR
ncbi:hypothetical protein MHU86_2010 [Fragilaria crotonensis]|nr:hypothetical protein MHU86_2010 [Fragilaria crotonensis]